MPPWNVSTAIIVSAGKDQLNRAVIGVSLGGTYSESAGKAHHWKYENCKTLDNACEGDFLPSVASPTNFSFRNSNIEE